VVALLVLGPDACPVSRARSARWSGVPRASWQNVKTEIERELAAEDVKRHLDDARRAASEIAGATLRSPPPNIERTHARRTRRLMADMTEGGEQSFLSHLMRCASDC